jgi:hypothetical protein
MSSPESSDINTGLPVFPMTSDSKLANELQPIYFAIQTLQRELTAAKKRIAVLEAYNIAHP